MTSVPHLLNGYFKQDDTENHSEISPRGLTSTYYGNISSYLTCLWIPKVIFSLTKRNLVRINYTEACSGEPSQPQAITQPSCSVKHNGCFC